MDTGSESRKNKAIVIGASIAGLLAARVLSEFYKTVVIVERDDLPASTSHRRGVPQGRHAHAILAGGLNVIEELFPGISQELIESGAVPSDALNDGRWHIEGRDLKRTPSGTKGIMLSRPMLEDGIRRRVRKLDGVSIVSGQSVRDLFIEDGRITGIQTTESAETADLVIDASGRGSRAPQWLEASGFGVVPEERVEIDLTYTTRLFRREPHHMNGDGFVVVPPTPSGKRGGVALRTENGEWIVTLFGHFGNQAPKDLDGYIAYATSLEAPYIYEFVRDAEPVGDAVVLRYPANIRRRYESMKKHPDGFLVFGDAICSFNPVYGQGMSSAALQAKALQHVLGSGDHDLAKRFYNEAAKVIENPWSIAVGGDLRMPEAIGPRNVATRLINAYMGLLHRRGHDHADAAVAFIRVAQLLDPPTSLMRPSLAARVLISAVARSFRREQTEPVRDPRASGQWQLDAFDSSE